MGGDGRLIACAGVAILAIVAWVLGHMVPFFWAMRYMGLLRVDAAEEMLGLDVSHHGGAAYEVDHVKIDSNEEGMLGGRYALTSALSAD
jgi:Amt family ammonium transporter